MFYQGFRQWSIKIPGTTLQLVLSCGKVVIVFCSYADSGHTFFVATRLRLPALGANPTDYFLAQVFLESRLSSEALEPLIGFVAYLEPKLWLKQQKLVINSAPTNADPGYITPILYIWA